MLRHPWRDAPPLSPLHQRALSEALAVLDARDDLQAVLLAGSVVGGHAGPTSDVDLYCVISRPVRQRHHLVTSPGVLVEMFFNPASQVRRYFADERRQNGPSTAQMVATGHVLLDLAPDLLIALQSEARCLLAAGPDPATPEARDLLAYSLRDRFDDCVDAPSQPTLAHCLVLAVEVHYTLKHQWLPKMKYVLSDLTTWDRNAANLVAAYAADPDLDHLRALVLTITQFSFGERRAWCAAPPRQATVQA